MKYTIWFDPDRVAQATFKQMQEDRGATAVKYPYKCFISATRIDVQEFFSGEKLNERTERWYRISKENESYDKAISVSAWLKINAGKA